VDLGGRGATAGIQDVQNLPFPACERIHANFLAPMMLAN
jgi:hypothetical protein